MFLKIRWRLVTPYLLLILMVMGGLAVYLFRPFCLNNTTCITQGVVGATVGLVVGAILIALLVSERTARPLRQLTHIFQRIQQGETQARLLPQTRDEVGNLIRAFNQMMEKMSQHLTQLENERGQLATVLTYMADGVLIADELGQVRFINPGARRLLKIQEKTALGQSIGQVLRHHQLIELWQRCRKNGEEQIEAVEIGNLFLQAAMTPFTEKESVGYLVILKDLTQVRRLETVRRDFISNLSHELRTPLASLRAVVETLQDSAMDDPAAAGRFLGRAEREVDTLTQMVEELLELSRIESGRVPLKLQGTAVSDLLLIPLERLREQAQRNELEIYLDLPPRLPPVQADAERVQQVVTNLVHNAIKFTPSHGRITLQAKINPQQSSELLISIKDTGGGIPEEDLTRIFERFYKSDRARTRDRRGGTGLGLAIARHIIQAHNGRIWAESQEGKGSTFFFTLPISR